jgi:hypothetical protein
LSLYFRYIDIAGYEKVVCRFVLGDVRGNAGRWAG